MKHHSPFKRLGFALALVLCPALTAGSLSPAFAATLEINSTVDHNVFGNSDDGLGTNSNGAPTGNTVHITGTGKVNGYAVGSYSETQNVSGNTVTLDDGANIRYAYGGRGSGNNAVSDNHVVMNGYDAAAYGVVGGGNWDEEGAGEVSGNTVTITDSYVEGGVQGGYGQALVSGNTVTIDGYAWVTADVSGGYSEEGEASGNEVTVNGTSQIGYEDSVSGNRVGGDVTGGYSDEGEAIGNIVTISGGTIYGNIRGGWSYGDSKNNEVEWTGGTISISTSEVFGGYSRAGNSIGNSVLINGANSTSTVVYGGRGFTGDAVKNSVTLQNGTVAVIYGGNGVNARENSIIITGGEVIRALYGGYSEYGAVEGNTIEISGGKVGGSIDGGFMTYASDVKGNHVVISGGEIGDIVRGGYSNGNPNAVGGMVTENIVEISGGAVGNSVYGGFSKDDEVSGNQVLISGGTIGAGSSATAFKGVVGGYSATESVSGNNVTVAGDAKVLGSVYGGRSTKTVIMTDKPIVNDNKVTVSGTAEVTGNVWGGYNENGGVSGNTVTLEDGAYVDGLIYGGEATGDDAATDNHVIISGGTLGDDSSIIGGSGKSGATNNTVTIMGDVKLGSDALIFGGVAGAGKDSFSGNTFNLKTAGLTIDSLVNFEFLNFYLPTDFEAGEAMLTVTSIAQLTENADGTGRSSIVNVGIDGNSSALQAGDSMILIDAESLVTNEDLNSTVEGYGKQGSTLDYIFGLTVADNQLVATVKDVSASEDSKVLSEGVVSGLALATQGSDLTAGEGLGQAVSAAAITGFGTFSAMGAGALKYDTGSSVDVNGFSLMAGLSFGNDLDAGRLTMGAFFEYGNGSYDTHNSFSGVSVDGGGDTDYVGGGLLGRMDFAETNSGHFYTEFSARMGRLSNDFKGSDSLRASYESSASYHGLHAGLGYVWNVGEKTFLDLYGKYMWTHQGGDSVKLSTGDPLEFEAADSHRVRVGGRLSYQANENIAPYVGAAYEHEFDGKAMATTYGKAIDAPDMKGGTGIGELGFTLKPSQDSPVSFDLGVQGYTGLREGVTGSLQIKFEF